MKVLTRVVQETSLLSIERLLRDVRISNFEIWMKLWMLLSENKSFLSFVKRFNLDRFEWLTILSKRTY